MIAGIARPHPFVAVALLVAAAFALAACGDADEQPTASGEAAAVLTPADPSGNDTPAAEDAAAPPASAVASIPEPEPAVVAAPPAEGPPAGPVAEGSPAEALALAPAEPVPAEPRPDAAAVAEGAPVAEEAAAVPADDLSAPPPEAEAPALPPLLAEDLTLTPDLLAILAGGDPIAGRTYATRCAACHALDPGGLAPAAAQIGPPLYGMFGARIGAVNGFGYSPAFAAIYATEARWTAARLEAFLADPEVVVPGTAMNIRGVSDPEDRANIIAFIRSLAINPLPLDGEGEIAPAEGNPELLALIAEADIGRGQTLAARCSGCHRFGADDAPLTGPNLYGIVGAVIGGKEGFNYSVALRNLNAEGAIWTYDRLDAYLQSPAAAIPGTRMGFAGVADITDRAAIIAYLRTLAATPYPLAIDTGTEVGVVREGLQPVVFTRAQADAGATGYVQWCAECHGDNLRGEVDMGGVGVSPPLVGPNFEHRWYTGTIGALFAYITRREPFDAPGELAIDTYAEIMAYIMARNGFQPGATPFPIDQAVLDNTGFFQQ